MRITAALWDGVRRVARAPAILVGVWLATVLFALPLGLALRSVIEGDLGASLAAESALTGVNTEWWQEFRDRARGLGATFTPEILGFAAVLSNLSAFLDNERRALPIAAAGAMYMLGWMFLAGGILDRYARNTATHAHGFFAACGVFFFRFLRLAAMAWVVYYALFAWLHRWLFGSAFPDLTREFTVERNAFFLWLMFYLVFGVVLVAVNLVFDYAKVRAVVEDRRSMIGALLAGVRFVRRNLGRTALLYLASGTLFVVVVALYGLVVPGAGGAGWEMWLAFLAGQAYLLARLWVKLVFWASETALFQASLAHAEYVAAPEPIWPESPAAEAISRRTSSASSDSTSSSSSASARTVAR